MKKMLAIVIAVIALVSFTTCGFAKEAGKSKAQVFKGVITAIDTATSKITIKNEKLGTEKTLVVKEAAELSKLTVGEKVKATLSADETTATEITKITPKAAKAKKN